MVFACDDASVMAAGKESERLRQAGATVGPIYNIADAMGDPHFEQREIIVAAEDETFGTLPMHDIVPKMSATPGVWRLPAPELGQHNEEVLKSLGYGDADIARFRVQAVI